MDEKKTRHEILIMEPWIPAGETKREKNKSCGRLRSFLRNMKGAKLNGSDTAERFLKRYGLAILAIIVFLGYGFTVGKITEHRVTKEVTERVTSELEKEFQDRLIQQERERQAAAFLSDEASRQAAMDSEADALAKLLYGYRNNSIRDRKTLVWCVIARADNQGYPDSIERVVDQAKQWMFYSNGNPIRDDDRKIAMEQLREWHDGRYPAGFDSDFVYAEWSEHDIALRNEFKTTSKTTWWRYPES